MSHVAAVECIVKDLEALKVAADKLGFEFRENQTTHRWYGRFMNDWSSDRAAVNKGRDPKKFGTCTHALRLKSNPNGYEVGVVAQDDGESYDLVYDTYGSGRQLEQAAGVDLVHLRNEVAAEISTRTLQKRGWRVARQDEGQVIRLTASK